MSENILQLHQPKPCNDVASSLRRLADQIEAGEHGDWPVTTCIVVLGHTDAEYPASDGMLVQSNHWGTYGFGPRTDIFTTRGLLATAIRNWGDDD